MRSLSSVVESLGIGNRFFDAALNIVNLDRRTARSPQSARRFLFLQYDKALGSVLNATPVYEALRKAIPDAFIAVAAAGFSYDILKVNPYIDEVYQTPNPVNEYARTMAYFLGHMRRWRRRFDCVVTDSFNDHAKLTLLQIASGVPLRLGYSHRANWVHAPLFHPSDSAIRSQFSVIQNNLRILDALGRHSDPIEPSIFFSRAEAAAAEKLVRAEGVPEEGPLVVVVPQGSGGQPHIWFDDRFVATLNRIYQRHRARLVFVGGPREMERIEAIRPHLRAPSFSLAGKTSIPQLAAVLCQADLILTMDTGVLHVARAVQLPMVILTSASQTPTEWLPANMERYIVLRRDYVPCALCWKSTCATRECMQEITVDDVCEAVKTQLDRFPPTPAARQERLAHALARDADAAAAN
jgi:ADP-heptose:LPS heptosyltransferase